jgi:membrane-associated phospholipid phosphatase
VLLALTAGAAEPHTSAGWLGTAKADFDVFPGQLLVDAKATFFRGDNIALLAWAGLASYAMNDGPVDEDVADYFDRHSTFGGFDEDALFVIGSPVTHFAGTALWYVLEAEKGNDPGRQRAVTMFSALTITAAVTGGLKALRDNDQPDGQGWAWPSGHTSSSVAVASVLHEFYGLKVGLPAYAAAGVVAWRMMDDGDHWASDVLFGATLGWVVGHTVARRHGDLEIAGFEVTPYTGNCQNPGVGISLARRF